MHVKTRSNGLTGKQYHTLGSDLTLITNISTLVAKYVVDFFPVMTSVSGTMWTLSAAEFTVKHIYANQI